MVHQTTWTGILRAKAGAAVLGVPSGIVQLTPHHAIHMVRVSDKVVLIATAPSACMLLDAPVSSELRFSVQRDLLSTDK